MVKIIEINVINLGIYLFEEFMDQSNNLLSIFQGFLNFICEESILNEYVFIRYLIFVQCFYIGLYGLYDGVGIVEVEVFCKIYIFQQFFVFVRVKVRGLSLYIWYC